MVRRVNHVLGAINVISFRNNFEWAGFRKIQKLQCTSLPFLFLRLVLCWESIHRLGERVPQQALGIGMARRRLRSVPGLGRSSGLTAQHQGMKAGGPGRSGYFAHVCQKKQLIQIKPSFCWMTFSRGGGLVGTKGPPHLPCLQTCVINNPKS